MNLQEFRQKYPQYDDIDDIQLSHSLHDKYYSDIPYEDFAGKLGVPMESMKLELPGQAEAPPEQQYTFDPGQYSEPPLPSHEAAVPRETHAATIPKYPGFGKGLGEEYIRPPDASEIPESAVKSIPALGKQVAGGMGLAAAEQLGGPPEPPAAVSGGLPGMGIPGEEFAPEVYAEARKNAAKPMLELYKQGTKELEKLRPEGMTPLQKFAYDVSIAGVKMIPAVGVSMASKNPWAFATVFYPDVYANRYGQLSTQFPDMSPQEKSIHSHVSANIEVLTEKIPLGILTKFGEPFLKRMVKTVAAEGGQEAASGLLQSLYDMATVDPNATFMDAVKQAGYEGLVGAALGGGMVVATTPVAKAMDKAGEIGSEKARAKQIDEFLRQRSEETANRALMPDQTPIPQEKKPQEGTQNAVSQQETVQPNGDVQQPQGPQEGQIEMPTTEGGERVREGGPEEVPAQVREEITPKKPPKFGTSIWREYIRRNSTELRQSENDVEISMRYSAKAIREHQGPGLPVRHLSFPNAVEFARTAIEGGLPATPVELHAKLNFDIKDAERVLVAIKKIENTPKISTEIDQAAHKAASWSISSTEKPLPKITPSAKELERIKPPVERRGEERRLDERDEEGRRQGERRQDVTRREKIAAMSPEDQYKAIYGHELTGLNNRRAFNEDLPDAKVTVSIDVDALKTVNDNLGQSTGDELLKQVAAALHEVSDNAYHISGDEFYLLGNNKEELIQQAKKAQEILATKGVESEKGILKGLGFSFGVVEEGGEAGKKAADSAMKEDKKAREKAGERAGRGELPKNLTLTARKEKQAEVTISEKKPEDTTKNPKSNIPEFSPKSSVFWRRTIVKNSTIEKQFDDDVMISMRGSASSLREGVTERYISFENAKEFVRTAIKGGMPATKAEVFSKLNFDPYDAQRVLDAVSEESKRLKIEEANDNKRTVTKPEVTTEIDQAAHESATSPTNDIPEPTPAQKKAGNYKVGKVKLHGLDISIENPAGSVRTGTDKDGETWQQTMKHHYGYIRGTVGKDKDHIDVFLGPKSEQANMPVFVVDQVYPGTGKFDEHKVMMGFPTKMAARKAYLSNYAKGWKGLGDITQMSVETFKEWIQGNTTIPVGLSKAASKVMKPEVKKPSEETATRQTEKTETKPKPKSSPRQSSTESMRGDVENAPGGQYRGLLQNMELPEQPTDRFIGKQQQLPKREQGKPVRRETIIKDLERSFGMKIYQGRVKGKTRLGFHRKSNNEVRIKSRNDLEVTAHEVAHWIDDRFPQFQQAYRKKPYKAELKGVSYDAQKLNEGFAEFVRLYMTQETEAVTRAPLFYDKFQEIIRGIGIENVIRRVQSDMHDWYEQGDLARLKSVIGRPESKTSAWLRDISDQFSDKVIQNMFDGLQGIKIAERELVGKIQDADLSPYKNARLVAGSRGITKAVFEHGTIKLGQNGDIEYSGIGLRQVFEPVADVIDDTLLYFAARRAAELKMQGRENLMTAGMIKAGLKLGEQNPRIKRAHQEYLAFNSRMMDFYQQMGLVSAESRKAMEKMNANYVPFHRVFESAAGEVISKRTPFKRLTGGTGNLNDIMDNITYSTASLIHMALINRTKQLTYGMISKSKNGAKFATRIPKDSKAAMIDQNQVLNAFVKGMLDISLSQYNRMSEMGKGNPMIDQMLDLLKGNMGDFSTFFTFGHIPQGNNIDTVLIDGNREVFEIADPLFLKSIQAFGPKSTNLALRIAGGFKGLLTRAVTTMPDFQLPNLLRDTYSAYTLSKGHMVPVIDSAKGFVDRITKDDVYWDFLANGGGFSSTVHGETMRRDLEKFYVNKHINPKTVLHTPRRLMDALEEFNSAFEYGTRLAEYKKVLEKGGTKREAALAGREISTDFAMRGTSDFLRLFTTTVPFMNARLQGLYRLAREVHESNGKMKPIGENAAQFALRGLVAITLPTLALYFLNRDDERYKALPDWVRDLHWVIFIPGMDDPILIPKPFEVGQIFATIPERTAELIEKKDGKKYADAMGWIVMDALAMNPTPQIIKPGVDLAMNRKWTGGPIIPEDLRGVEPWLQYRPWTPETLIQLGKQTGLSPIKMEHMISGYFGSMGLYALMASDYLITDPTHGEKPELRLDQTPIIRRFIRQQPYRGTQYEQDFYKLMPEVEKVTRSFNLMQKRLMDGEIEKYLDKEERQVLFSMARSTKQVQRYASQISNQMRLIQRDPDMTGKEKRDKLNELLQQRYELFKQAAQVMDPKKLQELKREMNRGKE